MGEFKLMTKHELITDETELPEWVTTEFPPSPPLLSCKVLRTNGKLSIFLSNYLVTDQTLSEFSRVKARGRHH